MKWYHILPGFLLCLLPVILISQNLTGTWKGELEVQGMKLPIVFHLEEDSGQLTGKWDSPAQGAMGLAFSSLQHREDSLVAAIVMIGGSYKGRIINSDSISGIWKQGVAVLPLSFSRSVEKDTVALLENEQKITILMRDGIAIAGNLVAQDTSMPLVLIIAGSGPTDRNGNSLLGLQTNAYKQLAYQLDSAHIATFRFDKRGVGESMAPGMSEGGLTIETYVQDVIDIFKTLKGEFGFSRIFIAGHSEGALIGMLAAQQVQPAGYISIAGAGRPADEVLLEQFRKQNYSEEMMGKITAIIGDLKAGDTANNMPDALKRIFRPSVQPYIISWFKYDPAKEIKQLQIPVLILQGNCDIQVPIEDAQTLHKAKPKSKLVLIAGMSHTLKDAGEDCAHQQETYTNGRLPVQPELVSAIVDFVERKESSPISYQP